MYSKSQPQRQGNIFPAVISCQGARTKHYPRTFPGAELFLLCTLSRAISAIYLVSFYSLRQPKKQPLFASLNNQATAVCSGKLLPHFHAVFKKATPFLNPCSQLSRAPSKLLYILEYYMTNTQAPRNKFALFLSYNIIICKIATLLPPQRGEMRTLSEYVA